MCLEKLYFPPIVFSQNNIHLENVLTNYVEMLHVDFNLEFFIAPTASDMVPALVLLVSQKKRFQSCFWS